MSTLAAQFDALPTPWRHLLAPFLASSHYSVLCRFIDGEQAHNKVIYPQEVFHALALTLPQQVKVVILGQDPYAGEKQGIAQAHGLAFSVPPGVPPPPSLQNIFREITLEFGYPTPRHGCLDYWAHQGVLLLNTILTVERGRSGSHAKHGWERCTDTLIEQLAAQYPGLVFLLWGAHAQAKRVLIDADRHQILQAPHPSPLAAYRGFFGCGHFMRANQILMDSQRSAIDWRLPD
jgi:uracil-DNA glycosylase